MPLEELSMNDIVTTLAAVFSAVGAAYTWLVRQAQAAKDSQIQALNETIVFLKKELEECRNRE